MSRITVSKDILLWALDRRGLIIGDLKKKFPKIEDWVNGKTSPTIRQIEELSRVTATPFGYFFLQRPPNIQLPIPLFRTTDDGKPKEPSPDLIETVQSMEQRQAWVKEYLIKRGIEPHSFVGSIDQKEDIVSASKKIKGLLNLGDDWASKHPTWTDALRGLRNSIEDVGIFVVVNGIVGNNTSRALDTSEFRGFVLSDNIAPLVFINGADSKAAQMFTLAHEIAHIFIGKSAAFDLKELQPANDPIELLCNRIAAELLVPQDQLVKHWKNNRGKEVPYDLLARVFKVSGLVIARRALDLRLISKNDFFSFYNEYNSKWETLKAKSKQNSGGGDFYASQTLRIGRSIGDYVVKAVKEGSLLYSEAYRLTGLNGSSFDKFANLRGLKKTGTE